jgi:hypothetical protein
MQKTASVFLAFIFLITPSYSWYHGRTDLPDGDAETSCATLAGFDIGQELPSQFKSDYVKMPKGQWFRCLMTYLNQFFVTMIFNGKEIVIFKRILAWKLNIFRVFRFQELPLRVHPITIISRLQWRIMMVEFKFNLSGMMIRMN